MSDPWIQTHSGRAFDLLDPQPDQIDIEDIAWALSHLCRFTGHSRRPYSVAEHSVRVYAIVAVAQGSGSNLAGRVALLHDASEAYLGDVSSPLKRLLPAYVELEAKVQDAIHARFGMPPTRELSPALVEAVRTADLIMLATERASLLSLPPRPWIDLPPPIKLENPMGWSPDLARVSFASAFAEAFARDQLPRSWGGE